MKNKPQLTREQFDKVFNESEEKGHPPIIIAWTLLSTALEEQRAMFVEEVRNKRATIKWLWGKQKTDDECFLMVMEQVQRIAEFAKLNQLKGNHE